MSSPFGLLQRCSLISAWYCLSTVQTKPVKSKPTSNNSAESSIRDRVSLSANERQREKVEEMKSERGQQLMLSKAYLTCYSLSV